MVFVTRDGASVFGQAASLSAAPGGDECDDAGGDGHRDDVVEGGPEGLEDVEGGEHQDGEEEGVVVEDGEGGGLVLGDLREGEESVVKTVQTPTIRYNLRAFMSILN